MPRSAGFSLGRAHPFRGAGAWHSGVPGVGNRRRWATAVRYPEPSLLLSDRPQPPSTGVGSPSSLVWKQGAPHAASGPSLKDLSRILRAVYSNVPEAAIQDLLLHFERDRDTKVPLWDFLMAMHYIHQALHKRDSVALFKYYADLQHWEFVKVWGGGGRRARTPPKGKGWAAG